LTLVFRLEASLLQLHDDQAFQFAVVENNVEIFSVEQSAKPEILAAYDKYRLKIYDK